MNDSNLTRRAFLVGSSVCLAAGLAGCSSQPSGGSSSASSGSGEQAPGSSSAASQASSGSASAQGGAPIRDTSRSIVVFFSRKGENYDVGYIDEGNTAKVAYSIAGKVVSSVFEILPVNEYPDGYEDCKQLAIEEKNANARPQMIDTPPEFDSFDTVYLGYPIWIEDLPMIMYSFIESQNWSGKTVIPFCTFGSSGNAGTFDKLGTLCKGANVKKGLELAGSIAQNDSSATDKAVNEWLALVRA